MQGLLVASSAYNNVEYSEYRVYLKLHGLSPQLLGTVSFLENSLQVPQPHGSGSVDFWVVAQMLRQNQNRKHHSVRVPDFQSRFSSAAGAECLPKPGELQRHSRLASGCTGMNNATLKIFNLRGKQVLLLNSGRITFLNGRDAKGKVVVAGCIL
jgi:hypothetical protein